MSLDMTSFDAALKQHYTKDRIQNMVYKDNPLLAMVAKMEDFGGRNLPVPIIHGNPANRSNTFATAQAGTSTSLLKAFLLTQARDYSLAQIDGLVLRASKGDANAFLEAATVEMDGAINALTRSLAQKMFHSGFGGVGNVNATVTGTTLTLTNPSDITNFEVGDSLQFAADDASALRSGGPVVVSAINRSAGSMTTGTLSGISGLTSGDVVYKNGDRGAGASSSPLGISGLAAWIPDVAPSSSAFFGIDRTVDVSRLAGQRLSANGESIEESLVAIASLCAREGGKVDTAIMNYDTYANLQNSLGSKVQYVKMEVNPEIGFRGITVNGPRGEIQCIPDQNCPANKIYALQLDTWKLYSLGKAVHIIDDDSLSMLRQASADGVEVRFASYSNLGCNAPGFNGVVLL